jgi:uncharacterized membrane protein
LVFLIIGYVLVAFAHGGIFTACLDIADGRPVTAASFFKPRNLGMVFLAALLVGVATTIASFACFFPALIIGALAQFTIPFVIDRSLSPFKAFGASVSTVASNLGGSLLSWLVEAALVIVGAVACGVGLLVALPLAALILTYTYRKLTGGQVVALDQPGFYPPGQQTG